MQNLKGTILNCFNGFSTEADDIFSEVFNFVENKA